MLISGIIEMFGLLLVLNGLFVILLNKGSIGIIYGLSLISFVGVFANIF